jgi:hypothetical protein
MKSPFPGMDPYLERRWRDIHGALILYARERLNASLPPDLVARSEDRVYVESDQELIRGIHPGVRVSEQPSIPDAQATRDGGIGVALPVLIELDSEPVTEHFIQIMEVDGARVVTAIEFISPTNKVPGEGRDAYRKKRREFLDSDANLVEVDLVRAGDWISLMKPYRVPPIHRTVYRACVRRANRPDKAELYPITLRQRLPEIAIPLRDGDPVVRLDLQELLERAYESGRYGSTDYRRECEPPLNDDDRVWAEDLLRQAGRR